MTTDDFGNDLELGGESALGTLRDALEQEDWGGVEVKAAEIANRYGVTLTQELKDELCRALLRAEMDALSRSLLAHRGQVPEALPVLNSRAIDALTATVRLQTHLSPMKGGGIRVSEAATAYIADSNRERRTAWTSQTRNQVEGTLCLFADFTRDAPLAAITRENVADFLAAIGGLDPNYGRRSTEKNMNVAALLQKFPAYSGRGISNRTLNRHSDAIAGMFNWAIKSGRIKGKNPAKGHHRPVGDNGHDTASARRRFTVDELTRLFGGPLFSMTFDERVQPKRHTVDTALAWLIPIALFSGMRLDEMCGLRTEDVGDEEDTPFFDLVSYEGRRLKTEAARRVVPVHTELCRIGFVEYLAHIREQGS